jgi:signal transduction histidine kinase
MRDTLAYFFALNKPAVYFAYGLVFFVLGLALLLQSRSHSRLSLARRLKWLALFGMIHGLHEWGDLFIPIQSAYLRPHVYDFLLVTHQVLLIVSFACLFQFAVGLVRPLPVGWAWVRWLPLASVVLWVAAVTLVAEPASMLDWAATSSVAARYVAGFPAALLGGVALIRRAPQLVAPLDDATTVGLVRIMGITILAYSVAAGLVVPRAAFYPADTLNTTVIEDALGVPVPVFRSLIALVLVVAVVRMLDVFNIELDRTLSAVEEAQVLGAERARLGRDLHDRTLQSVYAAGLVLATCLEIQRRQGHTDAAEGIAQAVLALDRAVEDLRSHIAELQSPPAGVSLDEGLRDRIHGSAVEAMAAMTVDVGLPDGVRLAPRRMGHVLAITSEALSNVARHSGAQHVTLTAHVEGKDLHLAIVDDGRGLPVDYVSGYGIENMRERARLLSGDLRIHTVPKQGTTLHLLVPLVESDQEAQT